MYKYLTSFYEVKPVLKAQLGRQKNNDDIDIEIVSQLVIAEILQIKLKHIEVPKRPIVYEIRNPVLRELMMKTPRVN